jgi:hypothetical protein
MISWNEIEMFLDASTANGDATSKSISRTDPRHDRLNINLFLLDKIRRQGRVGEGRVMKCGFGLVRLLRVGPPHFPTFFRTKLPPSPDGHGTRVQSVTLSSVTSYKRYGCVPDHRNGDWRWLLILDAGERPQRNSHCLSQRSTRRSRVAESRHAKGGRLRTLQPDENTLQSFSSLSQLSCTSDSLRRQTSPKDGLHPLSKS